MSFTRCFEKCVKGTIFGRFSASDSRVLNLQEICQFANLYVKGGVYQRAEDKYLATNASVV